jgi:hypothetical protein
LKKTKTVPEPKATIKKHKLDQTPSVEPKVDEAAEKTPPSLTAAEVVEILKVMTNSPPFKLLSPLGLELTKLLQRKETPSATGEKIEGQNKRRIVNIIQAIEQTPPSTSAPKAAIPIDAEDAGEAEAEELAAIMSEVDRLVSDMDVDVVAEETNVATKENMAAVPDEGKEIDNTPSDERDFDLRHLGGQELFEEDKFELKEFAISCGYQPGSLLFGGVDEEILGCIHDHAGTKIIGTQSKSVGFSKLETDISCYRRQHIVGSLFYSNFKVRPSSRFLLPSWWIECSNFTFVLQSMLLSKALKMQQDSEDRKNEVIVKELEGSLKEKDIMLQIAEGSLAEARSQNTKLSEELDEAQIVLSAFRPRGVPGPTSKLSPRAPAQMGRRETEREGGKTGGRQA